MNVKTISIALTVLVVALLATLLMQKSGYVSQATEHYEKTTTKSYKGASQIVEYVNNSIADLAVIEPDPEPEKEQEKPTENDETANEKPEDAKNNKEGKVNG